MGPTELDGRANVLTDPRVQPFLSYVAEWGPTYTACVVSCLVFADDNLLVAGRISFENDSAPGELECRFIGGLVYLRQNIAVPSIQEIHAIVAQGVITIGSRRVRLHGDAPNGTISSYSMRAHIQPGVFNPSYMPGKPVLTIGGSTIATLMAAKGGQEILTRSLQTNSPPYEDVVDLLADLGIKSPLSNVDATSIELSLAPPLAIGSTRLSARGRARFALSLAEGISPSDVSVGIRALSQSHAVLERVSLRISDEQVVARDRHRQIVFERQFKRAKELDVLAIHASRVVARSSIRVENRRANTASVSLEQIDPSLTKLREWVLGYVELQQKNSRGFEGSIAVLFSLLGFKVTPTCSFPPYGEWPDLHAWAQDGSMLLVEVSTGSIMSDTPKIERLVDRASQLRQRIQRSGHKPVVLAVFVTPHLIADDDPGRSMLDRLGVALVDGKILQVLFKQLDTHAANSDVVRLIRSCVPSSDPLQAAVRLMAAHGTRWSSQDDE